MAVLLKTISVRVSSIQIMQVRVQNKGKSGKVRVRITHGLNISHKELIYLLQKFY